MTVSTIESPMRVLGIHGGGGETWLKELGAPSMMFGVWDAFEYVVLPPGGTAGVHRHNHTEEIWLVVSGRNTLTVEDEQKEIGSGDVVLTSYHGAHGSHQVGDEPFVMLVIAAEYIGPRTLPVKTKGHYFVGNLRTTAQTETNLQGGRGTARVGAIAADTMRPILGAPWDTIALISLDPGSSLGPRNLNNAEVFVFITAGQGIAHVEQEHQIDLAAGTCLTYVKDSLLHLEQKGNERLEFYFAELGIPEAGL